MPLIGASEKNDSLVRELLAAGVSQNEIARRIGTNQRRLAAYIQRKAIPVPDFVPLKMDRHPSWKGGTTVDKSGYILEKCPDHPFANRAGYVRQHRLVMERHIGRLLDRREVVHHRNDLKHDNRIENLELFSSNPEHLAATLKGQCPKWTPEGFAAMLAGAARKKERAGQRKAIRQSS